MKVIQMTDVISLAVQQKNQAAVRIANHLSYECAEDDAVHDAALQGMAALFGNDTDEFHEAACGIAIGGVFFFPTMEEAVAFYSVFNQEPIYASGIFAELYDASGWCRAENT